jgi:DNA-binding response OmpR family regulator
MPGHQPSGLPSKPAPDPDNLPTTAEVPRRPTVLAVDDEPSILEWLTRVLDVHGYAVLKVSDPAVAITWLETEPVDALILDIRLAGDRSGLEILEYVRFRRHLAGLPVLMLTGVSQLSAEEEATIRRHRAYIFYKPQGADSMVATLDGLVERRPSGR